jgi:hypothetical protein
VAPRTMERYLDAAQKISRLEVQVRPHFLPAAQPTRPKSGPTFNQLAYVGECTHGKSPGAEGGQVLTCELPFSS